MKQRIITGVLFAIFMIAIAVLSGTPVYPFVFSLFSVIGTIEMLNCIGTRKSLRTTVPSVIYALLCPIIAYNFRYGVIFALTVCFMTVMLMSLVFKNENIKTEDVCTTYTMVSYVAICFSSIVRLRYVTTETGVDTGEPIGQYFFLLIFVAAWITDTFAYFTGFFFGKHKLCPKISPKKTIEGALGGTIFCVIAFVVYAIIISKINPELKPNFIGFAIVGLIMSVLSQTGDLLASVIKRTYGIKDYGNLFPGHGGVLDRFDSVLILAPFLLVLIEDAQFLQLFVKF